MLAGHPQVESPSALHPSDAPQARAPVARAQAELDSTRLLQGRREVLIRHCVECYRLRNTRNDKLILTK